MPKQPKQQQQFAPLPPPPAPAPMPALPKAPDPIKPDPVPQVSALEVDQSKRQQVEDAKKRKGIRKTLLAGEANQQAASPVTGSTLLG